jgi:hypothetical protein
VDAEAGRLLLFGATTWEITQRFGLESTAAAPRLWLNTIPAGTAPAEVGIPDTSAGMNRSALTNEYFNNAWYEVQMLVNSGNHRHHGRLPIDWVYFAGHYLDLQELSKRPEPARLLIAIIKAMQSTDPLIGPDNYAEGWRPERNIDPRILVSREWEPVFQKLPVNVRQAITESLLSAWLDKTLQFRPASYFVLGPQQAGYKVPTRFGKISGGGVWEAAQQFKSAGVSPAVIERLDSRARRSGSPFLMSIRAPDSLCDHSITRFTIVSSESAGRTITPSSSATTMSPGFTETQSCKAPRTWTGSWDAVTRQRPMACAGVL